MKPDGVRVVAYDGDGNATVYRSINCARTAYGIGHDRLIRLILDGDNLDGISFDFTADSSDEDTNQIELRYRSRIAGAADRKRRRRNAAQNEMPHGKMSEPMRTGSRILQGMPGKAGSTAKGQTDGCHRYPP